MPVLQRAKRPHPDHDMKPCADQVFRVTGLRIDFDVLDDSQAADLVTLIRKADRPDGFNLASLNKRDTGRFEKLAARAAGQPDDYFQSQRDEAEFARGFAELRRQVAQPPRRLRHEEQGSVRVPAEVFRALDRPDPAYQIPTLGLLVFLLAQFENGAALTVGAHMEGAGDKAVLVLDMNYGLGKFDPEGRVHWERSLKHLVKIQWFTATRNGRELRITRGPRALKAAHPSD